MNSIRNDKSLLHKARIGYISGEYASIPDAAKKLALSLGSLWQISAKEKWSTLRKQRENWQVQVATRPDIVTPTLPGDIALAKSNDPDWWRRQHAEHIAMLDKLNTLADCICKTVEGNIAPTEDTAKGWLLTAQTYKEIVNSRCILLRIPPLKPEAQKQKPARINSVSAVPVESQSVQSTPVASETKPE